MALRKATPVRFTPRGLSDAFDSTEAFFGACRSLSNLVFDQQNPELVICRPGVGVAITTFGGFTTPTFIPVFAAIGHYIIGMVSTGRNVGQDEPFMFNLQSNTFVTISGVTSGNTPTSLATTGDWTPPTIAVVGTKVLITHAGFNGSGSNFFGVLDISNLASPAWSSANTATNALPGVPQCVANFNNRAYFAVGNILYYSDTLVPLTRTNATQSITLGGIDSVTALSGLPVQTTSGGVTQALLAFKEFEVWQVTGDPAVTGAPLLVNYLSLNVGTKAGRSVVQTPIGTAFMAIDGPMLVTSLGVLQVMTFAPVPGETDKPDIQAPFIYSTAPTRTAAGYTGGVYRICVDTFLNSIISTNDYWFDGRRRRWSGPHTWPADCMDQVGNYFVVSHRTTGAALYKAQIIPDATTVYLDNGSPLMFNLESSTFPKDAKMNEKQVVESTIELGTAGGTVVYTINALNDQRVSLNQVVLTALGRGALWGSNLWGVNFWTASINTPKVYTVAWTAPVVFQKMALQVSGQASNNISIGTFFARYQDTGYMNANPGT